MPELHGLNLNEIGILILASIWQISIAGLRARKVAA